MLVATRNDTTNGIVISSTQTCGESITSKVRLSSHVKFNLISMYRPPKYGTADLEDLNELIETDSSIPSIIIGDLNLPDILGNLVKVALSQTHSVLDSTRVLLIWLYQMISNN